MKEIPFGADLDVVAFMGNVKVMVECKTSKPSSISEDVLRLFLQRAEVFDPEIAVLLLDTDSDISIVIDRLNLILEDVLGGNEPAIKSQAETPGLYWGIRNVFVTNIRKDIETSLLAVHRLYSTHVRHLLVLWGEAPVKHDYLTPRVQK